MNGLEATQQIRTLPGPRGIVPVVATTAQALGEQIELCRQAGMNTHLSKPFTQSAPLAAIEDIVLAQHGAAFPPISAPASAEPQLPVFDRAAFEDITDSLPLVDIARHLQTLLALGDSMLHGLRAPHMLAHADEPAKAAHGLAGGVGTFGFLSLAAAGRRFQRAADAGLPETAALGDALVAAIEASVTILRQELSAAAAPAI